MAVRDFDERDFEGIKLAMKELAETAKRLVEGKPRDTMVEYLLGLEQRLEHDFARYAIPPAQDIQRMGDLIGEVIAEDKEAAGELVLPGDREAEAEEYVDGQDANMWQFLGDEVLREGLINYGFYLQDNLGPLDLPNPLENHERIILGKALKKVCDELTNTGLEMQDIYATINAIGGEGRNK